MKKIRFLYMSRNQNRSGYAILDSLIRSGLTPSGVLLPPRELATESRQGLWLQKKAYQAQTRVENSKALRFFGSELVLAKEASIPVFRSARLDEEGEVHREISKSGFDLIFLGGGWPGRLPQDFTRLARLGALNTHPSLLPAFRGTSITRWQVLEGVSKSGVTIHVVNEEFDSGPIVAQSKLDALPNETPQELFQRLSELGADLAVDVLKNIEHTGEVVGRPQPSEKSRYYPKWSWNSGNQEIDFSLPLKDIHQLVLANTQESYRFDGPIARFNDRVFYVRETELIRLRPGEKVDAVPGRVASASLGIEGFLALRKPEDENGLLIKKIQPRDVRHRLNRAGPPCKFFSRDQKVILGG